MHCEIFSASRVTIGPSVLIAAYCYVIGGDHDFSDPSAPVLAQTRTSVGVTVGEGAWMGAGAKILGNIEIGHCARIASGSVVLKPVPHNKTVAGVPAKVIGEAGCPEPSRAMDHLFTEG